MALPNDFASVLAKVQQVGILNEDSQLIESRLALSVQSAAVVSGQRDLGDFSIGDWTLNAVRKMKKAIHGEMCDPEKKEPMEDYKTLFKKGLSPEGITAVAAVVVGIVSAISPAFAVSNIIIFLAIWVLKRGLEHFCSAPI